MNLSRIKGALYQELFITLRSYEVIIDIMVSPVLTLVLFGFLTVYLAGNTNIFIAHSILAGTLMWNIVFIIQYSVSVGSLWNIWSRNLSNMFTTPLSVPEYLFAYFLSGFIKSIVVFFILSLVSNYVFNFDIFLIGIIPLVIYMIQLAFFALSLGLLLLGLIFRLGTRIQAFAWGVLPIFQVLSASFYPLSVLPSPVQAISKLLPTTYIFESLRQSLVTPDNIVWEYMIIAGILNSVYFIISSLGFFLLFSESKRTGQFAKLET